MSPVEKKPITPAFNIKPGGVDAAPKKTVKETKPSAPPKTLPETKTSVTEAEQARKAQVITKEVNTTNSTELPAKGSMTKHEVMHIPEKAMPTVNLTALPKTKTLDNSTEFQSALSFSKLGIKGFVKLSADEFKKLDKNSEVYVAIQKLVGEVDYEKYSQAHAEFMKDVEAFSKGQPDGRTIKWQEYLLFTVSKPGERFSERSWDAIAGNVKDGVPDENSELDFTEFETAARLVGGYNQYLSTNGKKYQDFTSFIEVDAAHIDHKFNELAQNYSDSSNLDLDQRKQRILNELVIAIGSEKARQIILSNTLNLSEKFLILYLLKAKENNQVIAGGGFNTVIADREVDRVFEGRVAKALDETPATQASARTPNLTEVENKDLKELETAAGIDPKNQASFGDAKYEKIDFAKYKNVVEKFDFKNLNTMDGASQASRIALLGEIASNKDSDGILFVKLEIEFLTKVVSYYESQDKTPKNKKMLEIFKPQLGVMQHNLKVKIGKELYKDVAQIEGFVFSEKGWNFNGDPLVAIAALEKLKQKDYGDNELTHGDLQKIIDELNKIVPKKVIATKPMVDEKGTVVKTTKKRDVADKAEALFNQYMSLSDKAKKKATREKLKKLYAKDKNQVIERLSEVCKENENYKNWIKKVYDTDDVSGALASLLE